MTTTDSRGIVYLENTDPITPFAATINTLQSGTSEAIAAVSTTVSQKANTVGFAPAFAEAATPVSVTTAPGETGALVTININVTRTSRVLLFAELHVEPGGNAAGQMRIKANGNTIVTREWHSRSTSNQQWPSIARWWTFAAGTYALTLTGSLSAGSSGTSFDHPFLSVGAP